jgi:hypothetical protein
MPKKPHSLRTVAVQLQKENRFTLSFASALAIVEKVSRSSTRFARSRGEIAMEGGQ